MMLTAEVHAEVQVNIPLDSLQRTTTWRSLLIKVILVLASVESTKPESLHIAAFA